MKRNGKRREFAPQKKKDADGKIHRFFIVAALFTLLCAIFTISLAVAKSRGPSIDDGDLNYDVRVETVSGERGRIFDRNGVMLVGNTSTYSLIFEYGSMAYKLDEVNSALLRCVSTLNSTGTYEKRATDYFVLEGTYPNMTFTSDALDKNTNTGFYYNRFLINHSLPEKSTAKDIVSFFVNRYKLSEEKYSNEEISELIRLRYDMLRVGFGEYQEYVIATDLDSTLPADMELIKQIREQNIEGATIVKQDGRVY
ncbi:MAG: hypothetical protein IKB23_03920, partial [Clostridia bacterium]|nr:hypothetical protein [Clostridia bacterium]